MLRASPKYIEYSRLFFYGYGYLAQSDGNIDLLGRDFFSFQFRSLVSPVYFLPKLA